MELTCAGIRGLPPLRLSFSSEAPTVVTGSAASGKTRLLELIIAAKEAFAPTGLVPRAADFATEDPAAFVETVWQTEARDEPVRARWALHDPTPPVVRDGDLREVMRQHSRSRETSKVEYFDSGRAFASSPVHARVLDVLAQAPARIRAVPGKYQFVAQHLQQIAAEKGASLAGTVRSAGVALGGARDAESPFKAALARLTGRLAFMGAGEAAAPLSLFQRRSGEQVPLDCLSESERMLVLFAASFDWLGLDRSIVLVDAIERTFAPDEHVSVFDGLASLTNQGQLIVTTTSREVLGQMHPRHIVDLDALWKGKAR